MDPLREKEKVRHEVTYDSNSSGHEPDFEAQSEPASGGLVRQLQGRHMQMIAIGRSGLAPSSSTSISSILSTDDYDRAGGSIGAGLFVGSGGSFHSGGPGSVVCLENITSLPACTA